MLKKAVNVVKSQIPNPEDQEEELEQEAPVKKTKAQETLGAQLATQDEDQEEGESANAGMGKSKVQKVRLTRGLGTEGRRDAIKSMAKVKAPF